MAMYLKGWRLTTRGTSDHWLRLVRVRIAYKETVQKLYRRRFCYTFLHEQFEDTKVRAWQSTSVSLSAFPSSRATLGCTRAQSLPPCSELLVLTSLSLFDRGTAFEAGAHERGWLLEEVILAEWGFYNCCLM